MEVLLLFPVSGWTMLWWLSAVSLLFAVLVWQIQRHGGKKLRAVCEMLEKEVAGRQRLLDALTERDKELDHAKQYIRTVDSELSLAKLEAHEQSRRFSAIFYENRLVKLLIEPQCGVIVDANTAALEYYGYTFAEITSLELNQLFVVAGGDNRENNILKIRQKQEHFFDQHRLRSGEIRDVEVYTGEVVMSGVKLYYATVHDITKDKKRRILLQKGEQVANIGSWELNVRKNKLFVSIGLASILGIDKRDFSFQDFENIILPDFQDAFKLGIHQLVTEGKAFNLNVKIRNQTTCEVRDIHSIAEYDKYRDTIFGVLQDVTLWKVIEHDLKSAKEKAEESDKLKTAFLANISHEVRTPMNAILGFSELLTRPGISDASRERFSRLMKDRSYDLLRIIEDIIDLSKINIGQMKLCENKCPVGPFLKDIYEYYLSRKNDSGKDALIDLQLCCEPALENVSIQTDIQRLRQVLINLLDNSFKFTKQGKIEIGCKLTDRNEILFSVSDTGIGIPPEKQSIIFDSFRQVEDMLAARRFGGAGLGLSIAKGICDLMNGKIWFGSVENTGTTFYVSLPYKPC